MPKITRTPYSLLELFAVIAVLAVISSLVLASLYRFRRDYIALVNDAPRAREVRLIRSLLVESAHRLAGPLTEAEGRILSGGEVAAEIENSRLRLRSGDVTRSVALPLRMTAALTVADDGRVLVLTLTPLRAADRSFRIVAAAGGKEATR